MNGNVTYNGSQMLSGAINVNTTGNIQALNVQITENGERTITPPEGVDGYAPITIDTNVPIPEPVLDSISITQNGTYTPPSGTDGYDEITVNVPQLEPVLDDITITENGTYTPPSGVDGYDEVNVSVSGYTIKTLSTTPTPIASFTDGTSNPLKSLTASIVPVQDLHGYDAPWAGGAGKNKLPMTVSGIKAANTGGTWNGNVYTASGSTATITILTDSDNNVIGIKLDGTFSSTFIFYLVTGGTLNGSYILTGCPQGGGAELYRLDVRDTTSGVLASDVGSGKYVTINNKSIYGAIRIQSGTTVSNIIFYPMLRLSTESDSTFAPYSNICPISGWTEEVITVTDDLQNPTVTHTTTIPFTDGQGQSVEVYGGEIDVINGVVTPCPYYASYNGEQLTGEWISDRDVYAEGTTPTIGAQVDNIGATGTPFNTQPTSIKSLDGENIVSASTGDVEELKYFADL